MDSDPEGGLLSVSLARPPDEIQVTLRRRTLTGQDYSTFDAELSAPSLHVYSSVITLNGDQLDAFFEGLAADWRGWPHERVWNSLEGHMSIAAAHDGLGHVELRVTLRGGVHLDRWSASASILHAAGEELTNLAQRVASFIRS